MLAALGIAVRLFYVSFSRHLVSGYEKDSMSVFVLLVIVAVFFYSLHG